MIVPEEALGTPKGIGPLELCRRVGVLLVTEEMLVDRGRRRSRRPRRMVSTPELDHHEGDHGGGDDGCDHIVFRRGRRFEAVVSALTSVCRALGGAVIQRCFRIFKWQKENAHIRQERNDAARRVQRYAPKPFPTHAPKLLRTKGASTASSRAQQAHADRQPDSA